jgi:hypothetical protein
MKNGKVPNKKHKIAMSWARLDPDDWLVTKSLPNEYHLVHRKTGQTKVIPA